MDLYRYFLFSSYSLFAVSFVMLITTGRLNVAAIALFAGVLGTGWMIDTARIGWAISKRWANGLMLACLATALTAWRFLGMAPIETVIHLTLFASSMKLLRWKSGRDWLWLYLVSFCLTLMTAGMMASAVRASRQLRDSSTTNAITSRNTETVGETIAICSSPVVVSTSPDRRERMPPVFISHKPGKGRRRKRS